MTQQYRMQVVAGIFHSTLKTHEHAVVTCVMCEDLCM